jgi:hypothetical protein
MVNHLISLKLILIDLDDRWRKIKFRKVVNSTLCIGLLITLIIYYIYISNYEPAIFMLNFKNSIYVLVSKELIKEDHPNDKAKQTRFWKESKKPTGQELL